MRSVKFRVSEIAYSSCDLCLWLRLHGVQDPPRTMPGVMSRVDKLTKERFMDPSVFGFDRAPSLVPRSGELSFPCPVGGIAMVCRVKLDDVWVERGTGKIVVVDYKTTQNGNPLPLYKEQLAAGAMVVENEGYEVSEVAVVGWFPHAQAGDGIHLAVGGETVMHRGKPEKEALRLKAQDLATLYLGPPPPTTRGCQLCAHRTQAAMILADPPPAFLAEPELRLEAGPAETQKGTPPPGSGEVPAVRRTPPVVRRTKFA